MLLFKEPATCRYIDGIVSKKIPAAALSGTTPLTRFKIQIHNFAPNYAPLFFLKNLIKKKVERKGTVRSIALG